MKNLLRTLIVTDGFYGHSEFSLPNLDALEILQIEVHCIDVKFFIFAFAFFFSLQFWGIVFGSLDLNAQFKSVLYASGTRFGKILYFHCQIMDGF